MSTILNQIPSMTKKQLEETIVLCQQRLNALESSKLDAVESEVLLAFLAMLRAKNYPDVPSGDVRHIKWQRGLKVKEFKTAVKSLRNFEKKHLTKMPNRSLQRWRKLYMVCVHRYVQNGRELYGNPAVRDLIGAIGIPECVVDFAFPGYLRAGLMEFLFK